MSIRRYVDSFMRQFERDFVAQNQIEVSQSAIRHNLLLFSSLTDKKIIPVLKGNAYGHGVALIAQALKSASVPYVAVDGYFEALRIREVSKQPVLVMGAISPINFSRMKYDNFTFVVHDAATIDALGTTGKVIKVHLECNTGMNRYGAGRNEISTLTHLILSYPNLQLEGVMSHLADSDGNNPATVDMAVALFDKCVEAVIAAGGQPTLFHVAQTAGSLKAQSKYANAIRLGIGLYGVNPFSTPSTFYKSLRNLKPALRFTSTITKIIPLEKGDGVSYNYTYKAPKRMKLGVIPAGYYEGVPRPLSNVGLVKIGQHYAPIIGRVCMNHTMINLDGIPAKVGDGVEIFSSDEGSKTSVDAIAHDHALFNYNLLTALSSDVRRVLVPQAHKANSPATSRGYSPMRLRGASSPLLERTGCQADETDRQSCENDEPDPGHVHVLRTILVGKIGRGTGSSVERQHQRVHAHPDAQERQNSPNNTHELS